MKVPKCSRSTAWLRRTMTLVVLNHKERRSPSTMQFAPLVVQYLSIQFFVRRRDSLTLEKPPSASPGNESGTHYSVLHDIEEASE